MDENWRADLERWVAPYLSTSTMQQTETDSLGFAFLMP